MTAAFWALVALAASGAVTQGGSISETVGANLILGTTFTPLSATTGPLVAATFMTFGVYSGYPVPAAFATTGAIVGVGLSLGGDPALDTYRRIGRSDRDQRGRPEVFTKKTADWKTLH